jgi:hypothetical protein
VKPKYFPVLDRGVAMADEREKPKWLHAGGPAAKIVGQEAPAAFRIALWCASLIRTQVHDDERGGLEATLTGLNRARVLYDEVLPDLIKPRGRTVANYRKLHEFAYTLREPVGNSPAVIAARYALLAFRHVPGAHTVRAVQYAGDASDIVCAQLAGDQRRDYLRALDDVILGEELAAVLLRRRLAPVAISRVLWRGTDQDGATAMWLVREHREVYGLLWRPGKRWTYQAADRANTFATVPDKQFARAVEVATARDT